jgi:hypothetical protein
MDGGTTWKQSIPVASGPIANASSPIVTAANEVVVGTEDGRLRRIAIGADAGIDTPTDGPVLGAVLLGKGGTTYAVSNTGTLEAWNPDFTPAWSLTGLGSAVQSSPAIDCARDAAGAKLAGRPGVLYVASNSGKLFSFIVDSHGLDTTAPWPKYQHDPRNTGNSSTPMTEFICP